MLIQPHMEQRCLQKLEKQTNPQQALQPFLPLFLPLLPSSLASLPSPDGHSCFRHMAEASVGVCMAWGKDQVLTGREPALLSSCFAAQGRKAKLQRTWQGVGTSIRMQIPALGFLGPSSWGIPRAFHTHCQLPVPAHQQPGREKGQALTAFAKRGLCPWPGPCAECHTDIQLPLRSSLLLCTSLGPLLDPVPKRCPSPRSHSSTVP